MSVWTTPITWANGAVTAATMNAEVRDHLAHLKGAMDLITAATTADTGTATFLRIIRAGVNDPVLQARITGDTVARFQLDADGDLRWGAGGASALDAVLERESSVRLKLTGPALVVERASENAVFYGRYTGDANDRFYLTNSGQMRWGPGTAAVDTGLDRAAAGILRLPDSPDTMLMKHGAAVGSTFLRAALAADTNYRFLMDSEGHMYWSDGTAATDVHLVRQSGSRLLLTGLLQTTQGVSVRTNAGAHSDALYTPNVTPVSGMIGLDTTNSRLYVRVGTTWKYVALI